MRCITLTFLWLSWTYSLAQSTLNPCPKDGICPFHKILLKNNYELNIGDTINNRRTIRLTGHGIDTIIRSVKLKVSNLDLGWLAGDTDDCFALYSMYSGNYTSRQPISIYIFEKQTGKLLVTGPLIEYDSFGQTVLYIDLQQQEKLGLYDMNKMNAEFFDPINTSCEYWWRCIKYCHVTSNEVSIDYSDLNNYTRRKFYPRK